MKQRHGFLMTLLALFFLLPLHEALAQEKAEETYSISLVQTAEVDQGKEVREVDNKKVLTETYTVREGDHIWQIFRERGLLTKRNLPELLLVLKRLNKSLTNLDLIYPGEKIVVPLTISPVAGLPRSTAQTVIPLEALKDVKLENYTVKTGDALIKVVKDLYNIPDQEITEEYLDLLKRLNPEIEDLNIIHPGQVVRLPVYQPELVRMRIRPDQPSGPTGEGAKEGLRDLSRQLMEVFSLLGEEWVSTGEHFIPLQSGGQISLKADSFPILNLTSGLRIVVDMQNDLPEKMAELISSNWENYRIVHLEKGGDLRGALDKILSLCNYHKLYGKGEPLEIGGDIPLRISADWIIKQSAGPSEGEGRTILLMIEDPPEIKVPQGIKDFLETLDIRTVEYPPGSETAAAETREPNILRAGPDSPALVELLLNLVGQPFSRNAEIRLYQGDKTDFSLEVKADFLLQIEGRECIIDFSGLGQDILSLLKERRFQVLTLTVEKDPAAVLARTLAFLGVKFDAQPHPFMATAGNESKNIRLTIPGITFKDKEGLDIFASHLSLPDQLTGFLSGKGYTILTLPPS